MPQCHFPADMRTSSNYSSVYRTIPTHSPQALIIRLPVGFKFQSTVVLFKFIHQIAYCDNVILVKYRYKLNASKDVTWDLKCLHRLPRYVCTSFIRTWSTIHENKPKTYYTIVSSSDASFLNPTDSKASRPRRARHKFSALPFSILPVPHCIL